MDGLLLGSHSCFCGQLEEWQGGTDKGVSTARRTAWYEMRSFLWPHRGRGKEQMTSIIWGYSVVFLTLQNNDESLHTTREWSFWQHVWRDWVRGCALFTFCCEILEQRLTSAGWKQQDVRWQRCCGHSVGWRRAGVSQRKQPVCFLSIYSLLIKVVVELAHSTLPFLPLKTRIGRLCEASLAKQTSSLCGKAIITSLFATKLTQNTSHSHTQRSSMELNMFL